MTPSPAPMGAFVWPAGIHAAVSFTFDDARPSQVDVAIPMLESFGMKGTFYVSPAEMDVRLDGWRRAVAGGHEIGNHTMTHPCMANHVWARDNALEDYTLERIEADILAADRRIEELVGVRPVTFAYPCGQRVVGRGVRAETFVPFVARRYVIGRSAHDELPNAPDVFDLSQALASDADHPSLAILTEKVDRAAREGGWHIFFAHEVSTSGVPHAFDARIMRALLEYASRMPGLWVDTVAAIGTYVKRSRGE